MSPDQTTEARVLADNLARLEGEIDLYRKRLVIEDEWGRRYRLERSSVRGGNTDDPRVVLRIRIDARHPDEL